MARPSILRVDPSHLSHMGWLQTLKTSSSSSSDAKVSRGEGSVEKGIVGEAELVPAKRFKEFTSERGPYCAWLRYQWWGG